MEKPLFENWPTNHIPHLIKGLYYMNYAWFARGTGFADSVSEGGWKLYGQRLDRAEEAFETAWKMNPTDVRIAEEMLRKEQSQTRGRERMELWFGRAMALDTNSYTACNAKRYYLEPKWYGSPEELLAFGRECVQSTNWGGRVPLILAEAHEALSNYGLASEREKYWKNPKVWPDVKASYEKYLKLVPQSVTGPSRLVRYAYLCEQWDEFNQRVARLSTTNYAVFGGKEKFEAMVTEVKERVGQAKDRPKQ
jgi:hypothetical protein